MDEFYDAVIVGAGMTGQLTALALAGRGFSVLLCDRAKAGEGAADPRTTALAFASHRALDRLGVWAGLDADAQPVTDIIVANGTPPSAFRPAGRGDGLRFDDGLLSDGDRWDGMPLAFIVPNGALAASLEAAAKQAALVTRQIGPGVVTTDADDGGVTVTFGDGSQRRASMAIGCDGRRSRLRRQAGLRTIERDFGQDAITFIVSHTTPHGSAARQIFLPGGPLAALPLPERGGLHRSSIVWSMPRAQADALMIEPGLLAGMAASNLPELGQMTLVGAPARFPLSLLYATSMVGDRLALIGEAGRAIHPLAGQGFNMAITDACALADVLADAAGVGLDIGHGTVLARYDDWRRGDAALTAFGTTGLARILSTSERITRRATEAGFGLVSRSKGLRAAFASRAGGAAGRVPSLMARAD